MTAGVDGHIQSPAPARLWMIDCIFHQMAVIILTQGYQYHYHISGFGLISITERK